MGGGRVLGSWSRDDSLTVGVGAVLLALLYLASLHSYLLFHTLAEIVFIVVCITVLVMAVALRQFLDDDFALFLGVALSVEAFLHIVHVVDYPGVNMISQSLDPPTQMWLAARFLLAVTFIVAPFVIGKRLNLPLVIAVYVGYAVLMLATVYWWHVFPATLLDSGLTIFKKVTEYVICLMLGLGIFLLWRRHDKLPQQSWRLLRAALVASIISELWFTLYHTVATWPNLFGHFFLVISALLFFRAVVDDGLARPHLLVMRNLREAEALHQRLESGLMPNLPVVRDDLHVVTYYRPGEHQLKLSGDFIDVLDLGERGISIICGDVSGHDPDAAALGAMLRASWEVLIATGAEPATIVFGLESVLMRERKSSQSFATFCLAWIDPSGGEVRVLNVGHPTPLLIGETVTPLDVPPRPPLGSVAWPVEEPSLISLPPDWQLFFYTDGLIEGRTAPGAPERYGEERLIRDVRALARTELDERRLEQLVLSIERRGGESFSDDVTVMVVAKSSAPASGRASLRADAATV
jgi:hypothetical protein